MATMVEGKRRLLKRADVAEHWRSMRVAAWLGWQVESNWTEPFLFAVYVLAKPLAGALILVFMYNVVTQGRIGTDLFNYMYVSNAWYALVAGVLIGVSWAIIDDREHYRTLKYVITGPIKMVSYLIGRALAKTASSFASVVFMLLVGVLVLGVPVAGVQWGMLLVYVALGVWVLAGMGLMLAGLSLVVARHAGYMGEIVAGSLALLAGAFFPIDVLPGWLQGVSTALPVTWWLEGVRRSWLGQRVSPALAGPDDGTLLLMMLGFCLLFSLLGYWCWRWCEHRAKELGLVDRTSEY